MQKLSTLADDLWPFLVGKVARVNRNGGGRVNTGTGGSAGSTTLDGLTDVTLTSLVDGQTLAYNDASGQWVNVVPSGGGGGSYVAGLGIDITGTTISAKWQAAGGIAADSGGLTIVKPLDSGLNLSASGLVVGAGDGIAVSGGTVRVDAIEIVDTSQGLGVSGNDIYLRLGTNGGLNFNVDGSLRMGTPDDLAYDTLGATSSDGHTHNIISSADVSVTGASTLLHAAAGDLALQNLSLNGDLSFILGNHNINASNSLHIQPATDLYLDPGGNVVLPDDQVARTPTFNQFIAGIDGWTIAWLGGYKHQLSISNILVDNLFAHKFTADEARVQRGEWFLTRSYGIVETAFTVPAVGVNVDVWFEEAPGLANAKLFLPNNWIEFRTIDWGTGLVIQTVWFQVVDAGASDYVQRQAATTTVPSRQQWRLKRMDGGFTGAIISKGEVGADFGLPTTAMPAGQMGQGVIYASSLYEPDFGPFIEVQVFDSIAGTAPHFENKVRMGNLQTTVDYTAPAWGFAAADDLSVLPSAGMSGFAVDAGLGARFFNTDLTMYAGGIPVLELTRAHGLAMRYDAVAWADPVRYIGWFDDLGTVTAQPNVGLAAVSDLDGAQLWRRLALHSHATDGSETSLDLFSAGNSGSAAILMLSQGRMADNTQGGYLGLTASKEIHAVATLVVGPLSAQTANLRPIDPSPFTVLQNANLTDRRAGMTIMQLNSLGDSVLHWNLRTYTATGDIFLSERWYSAGVDGNDGGKFKIAASQSLGTGADIFIYDPITGAVTINGFSASGSTAPVTVTAGDGITVVGPQISVNSSVARITTSFTTLTGSGLTGGGDLSTTRNLSVLVPGTGGLQLTTGGIVINDSLAGTGLTMLPGKVLTLNAATMVTPARAINTTGGLQGGGTLATDLTLSVDLATSEPGLTVTDGLTVDGSVVRVTRQITTAAGSGLTGGGFLSSDLGLAVDATVARTTVSMIAGLGLTGGGDLSATRTLAVGAGDGVLVSADAVAVDTTVVRTTRSIISGGGLTGGGLLSADRTLAVGAGDGITVNVDDVAVNATVVRTTRTLTAGAGLTGGGDLSANRTFDVVAGNGSLTVSADSVVVNQAFAFVWTGTHQFNANPQINAGLDFIGGTRTITSPAATNLSIVPGGDLILDPGGFNVLPGGGTRTDLGDYNRKWSTLYARELYVETLVASSVMATIGGRVMVTPTSSLISDVAIGATSIDLKHNIASFGAGTYIYLESAPGGIPQIEAMKITSASPTVVTGPPAGWRYTVIRGLNTSGAKAWLAGDATVSLGGAVSEGYIDLASVQTVKPVSPTVQKVGPTITIYSRSATTNWDDLVPTVTMGNLTSFVDYATTRFGFATGNDLTLQPDGANPFIGMTADRVNGLRLFNTPLNLYNTGNAILSIDKINGISFEFGANPFNTIGWYEDLGIPPASPLTTKLLGTVGVARAISGYTELDLIATGIAGSYSTGAVKLRGVNASAAAYNLWVDSSGVYFGTGTGARPQTGGFISDAIQYFSGNVGIGTAAPEYLLDVQGSVDGDVHARIGNRYWNTASSDDTATLEFSFWAQNAAGLRPGALISAFKTGNFEFTGGRSAGLGFSVTNAGTMAQALTILPSGFTGIGTTTPRSALDVGTGAISFDATGTTSSSIIQGAVAGQGFLIRSRADAIVLQAGLNDSNPRALFMRAGDTIYGLLMNNNGRISIGSSSAASTPLHVFGATTLGGTVSATGLITASAGATISAGDVIVSAGNVGIGNAAPATLLHIGPNTPAFNYIGLGGVIIAPTTTIAIFNLRANGGQEMGMMAHSNGNNYFGSWSNNALVFRTNNADRVTISAAGAVTIAGSGYVGPGGAAIPGLLASDAVTRGNTTTAETNLGSYTVTANTLAVDGSSVSFWAWGLLSAAAVGKTVKVYFGADVLTAINTGTASVGWSIRGTIIRKTATTQSIVVEVTYGLNFSQTLLANWTRTLSADNLFRLTGQGSATNDILQYGFKLFWDNAN